MNQGRSISRQGSGRVVAIGALVLLSISPVCSASDWAERLGFEPGKKIVLLHANEMGMCYESNEAISQLLEAGLIRSASAMPPCPWFADATKRRQAHADADVGLELTLNSEHDGYRWKSVAPSELTATLCDADGFLWRTPIQTMVNSSPEDVQYEMSAQIDFARKMGLSPTHLTAHLGTLVTRADLIEVYLRAAQEHWIPAVVVELTPEHIARFERDGFALSDEIIELFDAYPLPKVDDLQFIPDGDTFEQKRDQFLKMLDDLKPGITQITFSPLVESGAVSRITSDSQQRIWNTQLLLDEEIAAAIREKNIIVTDWRDLMRRFQGENPDDASQTRDTKGK